MSTLRLALVQVASSTDPHDNRRWLRDLDVRGADLVVLPEAFQRDFGRPDEPLADDAEPLDGPFATALGERAAATGATWVAGMFERSAQPGLVHNTLVVVGPDGPLASYRKIHLYDSFGYRESDRLAAGPRSPTVVEIGGVRVGLMTCYDLRFPELARELSRLGAQLLVVPAAWVAGPRKAHHWRTLLTARAIENVAYVAGVGQPPPRYTGRSVLVDPRGDVVAEAGEGDEVLTADLDPRLLEEARDENPSLDNRRDGEPWEDPADERGRAALLEP